MLFVHQELASGKGFSYLMRTIHLNCPRKQSQFAIQINMCIIFNGMGEICSSINWGKITNGSDINNTYVIFVQVQCWCHCQKKSTLLLFGIQNSSGDQWVRHLWPQIHFVLKDLTEQLDISLYDWNRQSVIRCEVSEKKFITRALGSKSCTEI